MNKQFKPLIGQTIYLIPTGNSIDRRIPIEEQITRSVLLKVGSTTLTTIKGRYAINGTLDRSNFGYLHFTTEQAAKEYFLKCHIEAELRKIFSTPTEISYKTLLTIKQLIDKDLK